MRILHIKDFGVHKEEITNCLKVLDQRAVELYEIYRDNLKGNGLSDT